MAKNIKFWDINNLEDVKNGIINLPNMGDRFSTLRNVTDLCGLHFTTNHNGKMSGMVSISTSPKSNVNCLKNHCIKGSICENCFSFRQLDVFTNQEKPLYINSLILSSIVLPMEYLPILNCQYFRFEAFGDLINETQVINYFNLCRKNKSTRFALWTKNPAIIDRVLESGYSKPKNLNIIQSALFLNTPIKKSYDFIDKVFVVYDKEKSKDVVINCGAKSCINCLLCYKKNNVEQINETLK